MDETVKLGSYNGEPITWSKIGELDSNTLYLCDTLLGQSEFGRISGYERSIVRKRCCELYDEFSSDGKHNLLVNHPEIGDPVFLLSRGEYLKYEGNTKPLKMTWWLRSPCYFPSFAAYVNSDGYPTFNGVANECGLRPAILMKEEN